MNEIILSLWEFNVLVLLAVIGMVLLGCELGTLKWVINIKKRLSQTCTKEQKK